MPEMSPESPRMARTKNRSQKHCPLLKLPDELLEMIIDEIENNDIVEHRSQTRSLIKMSLVNKYVRKLCLERVFRTVFLLRRGDLAHAGVQQRYAAVAQQSGSQQSGSTASVEILQFFMSPPLDLFAHTRSLAVHQFWVTNTSSSGYTDPKIRVVLKGLQAMLRAPRRLERLHLDLDQSWADMLEWDMTSSGEANLILPYVEEAIFGVEVGFMLKYTPNLKRLSNLTFMGRRDEAPVGPFRFNWDVEATFFSGCQSIPNLHILQLSVAGFQENSNIEIPILPSLESFSISHATAKSCAETSVDSQGLISTGMILEIVRKQPALTELHIPRPEDVVVGPWVAGTQWHWNLDLTDFLLAAIIFAKVPSIDRTFVGDNTMVEVKEDGKGAPPDPLRQASIFFCLRERPTVSLITPIQRRSIFFANTTYGTTAHVNNTFRNDAYGSSTYGTNANAINTPIANEQQSPTPNGRGTQQNGRIEAGWHGTKEWLQHIWPYCMKHIRFDDTLTGPLDEFRAEQQADDSNLKREAQIKATFFVGMESSL
ncbi:hypothetical protein HDK77DRAFT_487957 [Phyllosticta capitalensis]